MNKPTEQHIETYILNRSTLSGKEQKWIRLWIQKDPEIRLLADWFEEFYKETGYIQQHKTGSHNPPPIIECTSSVAKRYYSESTFVLAAQTNRREGLHKKLKTIRTFISDEHNTLVRILHDSENECSKLHVISEFVKEDDIVLIKIQDQQNTLFVSDPGGLFTIPDHRIPLKSITEWDKCELHIPLSKIKIYGDSESKSFNFDTSEAKTDRDELDIRVKDQSLEVKFDLPNDKLPKTMVLTSGKNSTIKPVANGRCTISFELLKEKATHLHFYL